ncbi:macoilin, isoform CRA_a [Rattus norvegicus]|uniref:Macoilin, isoform CRA_a n=1 Tax=Rattus norvegicus TaxID=10116 RepID=A6IT36_RAT|nr:macoilin, isoform CRA_a [Rattus norvegicus]
MLMRFPPFCCLWDTVFVKLGLGCILFFPLWGSKE